MWYSVLYEMLDVGVGWMWSDAGFLILILFLSWSIRLPLSLSFSTCLSLSVSLSLSRSRAVVMMTAAPSPGGETASCVFISIATLSPGNTVSVVETLPFSRLLKLQVHTQATRGRLYVSINSRHCCPTFKIDSQWSCCHQVNKWIVPSWMLSVFVFVSRLLFICIVVLLIMACDVCVSSQKDTHTHNVYVIVPLISWPRWFCYCTFFWTKALYIIWIEFMHKLKTCGVCVHV